MARKYFTEDYYTETINDFNPAAWLKYGNDKMWLDGKDVKLVGVRNWLLERDQNGVRSNSAWHQPQAFSYGKHCKANTQTGMRNGFVELRFSYTPVEPLPI